jgi:hypothetical protein
LAFPGLAQVGSKECAGGAAYERHHERAEDGNRKSYADSQYAADQSAEHRKYHTALARTLFGSACRAGGELDNLTEDG